MNTKVQAEEILMSIGRPEARVSRSTQFSDLYKEYESDWLEAKDTISKLYGIEPDIDDFIMEFAAGVL